MNNEQRIMNIERQKAHAIKCSALNYSLLITHYSLFIGYAVT